MGCDPDGFAAEPPGFRSRGLGGPHYIAFFPFTNIELTLCRKNFDTEYLRPSLRLRNPGV
jgi:hypothetical protein